MYYLIERQGLVREKGFFVRRPGDYQKTPCVIVEEEKTTIVPPGEQTAPRAFRSKTITTPAGAALYREEEVLYGDVGRETITVSGGEAQIAASGYFGASGALPVPPGVLFEVSAEWLAGQSLHVGKTLTAGVLDREDRLVTIESITIVDKRENAESPSGPAVWTAEFLGDGKEPMRALFTSDGRLLRLESGDVVYQIATRAEYEQERRLSPASFAAPEAPPPGMAAIPIGAVLPAWDNFAWLVLRAEPGEAWRGILQTSEYVHIEDHGAMINIVAVRNAPRVDAAATLPLSTPPELRPYLGSTGHLPSQSRAIIGAARRAAIDESGRGQETNALRAVSYLAGWINQGIAFEPAQNDGSAVETLRRRAGDSFGQARLFAAMARALGIPSRLAQGFLARPGQAVPHSWAEAWINGGWIPVDVTVSRVGLPAGYVLVERSTPDGSFGVSLTEFLQNRQLTLELVSAGRETPSRHPAELVVGDRRTYAATEGDWLANLYWGFALRLPPGWLGSARLDSVEISSPDREANIKCEALYGEYRAGQPELDGNIQMLGDNLENFRLIDSRIVSFDAEGATPALFIDFACDQGGQNLRCRQFVLPRRQRAFRISFWAPSDNFGMYVPYFDSILASFEF